MKRKNGWAAQAAMWICCAALCACGGGGDLVSAGPIAPPSLPEPPIPEPPNPEPPAPEPAGWVLWKTEAFDADLSLVDDETFGEDGWLTATLRNGGVITIESGMAHVETPDFPDSALIRVTESLPQNYRIRVRLGAVDYDLGNYEPEDSEDPDFKYSGGWKENGFYWLTLTDRLVEPTSGEDWWHRYRKVVVDSDDHNATPLPVYMVYMNPDLDRDRGNWLGGQRGLLRTWSDGAWDTSDNNWNVAFNYDPLSFYEVELERLDGQVVFRAYDADGELIEESTPVSVDDIYGMGGQASEFEFAYVGEPHIDSYEGEAYVDSITMWTWAGSE